MKNISFEILKTAETLPDHIAISSPIGDISYKLLKRILWQSALNMKMYGINNTSCVAIYTKDHAIAIFSILAIGMIGAKWVRPTPSAFNNSAFKITHLLHTDAIQPIKEIVTIKIDNKWWETMSQKIVNKYISEIKGNLDDSDIWMIAQSSGTTGHQKFMELSYENYWHRNNKAYLTHDFTPVITANLFPILSGAWVSYNLRTLGLQGTLVLGQKIDFFLAKNIQKVFGSPYQFHVFLKNNATQQVRLPIAHVAGSTISKEFAKNILQHFNLIHNFYGTTEVGGVARKLIHEPTDETGNVGKILQGNNVKIVNEADQEVPPNVIGLIAVQNNIMIHSYMDNKEATSKCFRNQWFYSGDMGYFTEQGELYITGRIDDILNIGGHKINASDVDNLIKSCPDVEDAMCFRVKRTESVDCLMALTLLKHGKNIEQALTNIEKTIQNSSYKDFIRGVFLIDKIPYNTNGKPQRNEANNVTAELTPYLFS